MKQLSKKNTDGKIAFLMQAGLVLAFAFTCGGKAVAQTSYASPMPVFPEAAPPPPTAKGSAPVTIVPGGTPAAAPATPASTETSAAPATTTTTTTTTTTATPPAAPGGTTPAGTTPQPAPAAAAAAAPAPAPATPAGAASAAAPGMAPPPSAAELAIVKNSATLNSLAPIPQGGNASTPPGAGLRVTDLLSTPANIRPLPERYLIVKKDHSANDADSRLTAAREALAQGHYQAALELFDDLYRKDSHDMRIIMGRAVALQKLGQTDEAMDAYQVALKTDPHNIEALTNVLGLLKGQDAQTAIKKLLELRDLYPANADLTAQLGMVYGETGDYPKAIKYLDMADALKPGNAVVLYNKAVAYDHMGKTTEAANLYRRLLVLASDGSLDQSFPVESVRQRLATIR